MVNITRPVCSNTKCPMVLHGTCTIGRNEAGCNYEIFANTPAAKNAANVFMDNSIALQFKKPMPKILGVVTDKVDEKQVILGSTLRVDTIFSHEIEYKKGTFSIEVSPEENVTVENTNVLVDRHTLRNVFKVIKEGEVTFTVKYTDENGTESTADVAITVIKAEDYVAPPIEVTKISADKAELKTGESLTIQVRTDKDLAVATDVEFTVDNKLTKDGEPVLLGDKKTVKQVFKAVDEGVTEISAKTATGSVTKKVAVTVLDNGIPAVFQSISADPNAVVIGKDTVVTLAFDKDPQLADVIITLDDTTKLTQKVAPAISGNNVVVTYTGAVAGAVIVSGTYKGTTKTTSITVTEVPVTLDTVAANPATVLVGADTVVTATFNKTPELAKCTFTPSAGLTKKGEITVSGMTATCTFTGSTAGSQTVTVGYTGVSGTKAANITVNDPPAPSTKRR